MSDAVSAIGDLATARLTLKMLVDRVREHGATPEDRQAILDWLPKQRKVLDEIDAVLQVKTPTMDDRLAQLLDNPDWLPERWYVVTFSAEHTLPGLGPQMPLVPQGDRIKEILDSPMAARIAHIYHLEDDGSLICKR